MPKYNVPVQNAKFTPATSTPQLTAAFMSQQSEIAKELLGPKAENLASAKHIFTRLEDGTFMEEALRTTENLVISIRSNSLFVKDQNGGLRQIGLENNNGAIDITVSEPVKEFEVPPRPTFWTRVKSFFGNKAAKEQVKAYNDAIEFNAAFEALVNNEKYEIKRDPDPSIQVDALRQEEVKEAVNEEVQVEIKQPEVKAEPLKPSQMDPEQFMEYLETVSKQGKSINIEKVLAKENGTAADFYAAVGDIMEGHVARSMRNEANMKEDPQEKETFLNETKHLYTSFVAGLREYVNNRIKPEEVEAYYKDRTFSNSVKLKMTVTALEANGLGTYMGILQAQNEANKQMEQSQPSAQVQQQMQAQQVQQPEPQPMGKGGPA